MLLLFPCTEENEVDTEDADDVFVPSGMVRNRSFRTFKHEFKLSDATDFIISGTDVSTSIGLCDAQHVLLCYAAFISMYVCTYVRMYVCMSMCA